MNIYNNVKRYIEARGSNIRQFEIQNEMANGTISKWRDGCNPRLSTLEKVAKALDVSVIDLLE